MGNEKCRIGLLCVLFIFSLFSGCGQQKQTTALALFPDDVTSIEVTHEKNTSITSRKMSGVELSAIKEWAENLELHYTTFAEGAAPNETYAGGESWLFDINSGEVRFRYLSIDDCYIWINEEWYLVKTPADPPLETA